MDKISKQKRSELQDNVLSLAMTCPMEQCNPSNCPLFQVRQMELRKRLQWFKALTDEDLAYLNAYHYVCMKIKLEAQPVEASR